MISNRILLLSLFPGLYLSAVSPVAAIDLQACVLEASAAAPTVQAMCGEYSVPENPRQPEGRRIQLRVAKVPARAEDAAADPVFLFAGGPGQAATEAYPLLAGVFNEINARRDIILIDQRGTGGSNRLDCPVDDEDFLQAFDLEFVLESTRECLQQLDGDPRYYTTPIAMADYDQVRAALGYDKINLWGGSYGTRAAQVYLRLFPERVRSVVLDSVVPPRLALGAEHASQLDRVINAVLERCAADSDCHAAFPELADEYAMLVADMRQNPREMTIDHPVTGEPQPLLADRNSLAVTLRFLSYSSNQQALIPLMVHRAAHGELDRLLAQGVMATQSLMDQLSRGMEMAVTCTEDEPFIGDISSESDTLIGTVMIEALRAGCSVWPRGEVPVGYHENRPSAAPTLLLAGEMDPVTPPAYARETAEQFTHHALIEVPGRGHLVSHHGCLPELVTEFIDSADPAALDTACVEKIGPEPFFTSTTGPRP